MKYEKIYKKLKEKYSDKEIVDSMLIPQDLTEKESEEFTESITKITIRYLYTLFVTQNKWTT